MAGTVILGSGIIGVATAYYLSDHQPPDTVHLVEPAQDLFSSASGFAGGFLAEDWFGSDLAPLGKLSYRLHKELSEAYGGREKWGYTPTTTLLYTFPGTKEQGYNWPPRQQTNHAEAVAEVEDHWTVPKWMRRQPDDHVELNAVDGTTAQLDPLKLCQFLLRECLDRGVRLHHPAEVISVGQDMRNELSSVCVANTKTGTETDVPCTRLILAAGPWSPQVFKRLFPLSDARLPITALSGHSLLLKSPKWKGEGESHVVYSSVDGWSPGLLARPDGTFYIGGLNHTLPLPTLPGERRIEKESIEKSLVVARELLGDDIEVLREEVCFRPVTAWKVPIIQRMEDSNLGAGTATRPGADGGVFVAAGHGPWGISLALGTGAVVAELVQGRKLSARIDGLGMRTET
jgi:glycine/D-amino acid oxidase-like deaminating enzyme